jgi:hypothetical protein
MGDVTGFETRKRNVGLMDNDKRDAVVLLDGDETDVSSSQSPGRASLMRNQIMRMNPELYVVIKETRPGNDTPANVGTQLNAYRDAILKAVYEDTQLATLLGSNGKAVYNGCATDLKSGSALSGSIRLDFAFTYPLILSEL